MGSLTSAHLQIEFLSNGIDSQSKCCVIDYLFWLLLLVVLELFLVRIRISGSWHGEHGGCDSCGCLCTSPHTHTRPVWKIIDLLQMHKLGLLSHLLMQC